MWSGVEPDLTLDLGPGSIFESWFFMSCVISAQSRLTTPHIVRLILGVVARAIIAVQQLIKE